MPRPATLPAGNAGHAYWADLLAAYTFHATGNTGGADVDDIKGSNDATLTTATLSDANGLVVAASNNRAMMTQIDLATVAGSVMWRAIKPAENTAGMIWGIYGSGAHYTWMSKNSAQLETRGATSSTSFSTPVNQSLTLTDYCLTFGAISGGLRPVALHYKAATDSTWTTAGTFNSSDVAVRSLDSMGAGYSSGSLNFVGNLHYLFAFDGIALSLANLDADFADPYSIVQQPDYINQTAQDGNDRLRLKKASGTFSWDVDCDWGGSPTSIEWRFGGTGSWTVGDASPTGGTSSFTVNVDGTVGGQGLEVRFSNDTGITDNDPWVTVADDVYMLAKDSLGSGRLTNENNHTPRTYTILTYTSTNDEWLPADDDPGINSDGDGSHWPILADLISDDKIVAFLPNSASGQPITGYRASAVATIVNNAGCLGISGILAHGGANDAAAALATTDSAAAWQTEMEAILSSFDTAYPGCKFYMAMLGDVQSLTSADARATAIRQGTVAAAAANANLFIGANVWWRELTSDHLHPVTDQEGIDYANEWWFAVRSDATARPSVVQATHNEAKTQVTVAFDATLRTGTTLSTNSFEIKDDGTPVGLASASVSGTNVIVTLSSAASGTLTASMGANEGPYGTPPQGTSVTLPNSGGSFYPAAEAFFDLAVTEADTTPPVPASAVIPLGGTVVQFNFTEAGSPPLLPVGGVTGFSLNTDGAELAILSVCRTTSAQITVTVDRPILDTETLTGDYASGNLTDSAPTLNAVADFSAFAITNNSTQTAGGGGGTYPAETDVLDTAATYGPTGTEYDGRWHAALAAEVISTAVFGPASGTSGTVVLPSVGNVVEGVPFGPSSSLAGTCVLPNENFVILDQQYGPGGNTHTGNVIIPSASNVRDGVAYSSGGAAVGTLALPTEAQVELGVPFGADGDEFLGSLSGGGGGGTFPLVTQVLAGIVYGPSDNLTGTLIVLNASGLTPTMYHARTQRITLTELADYKTGTPAGPLLIPITSNGAEVDDMVTFGAELEGGSGSISERIYIEGVVVLSSSVHYAKFEIDGTTHLTKTPSIFWRWGLEHTNASGDVSVIASDQEMILLADRVSSA